MDLIYHKVKDNYFNCACRSSGYAGDDFRWDASSIDTRTERLVQAGMDKLMEKPHNVIAHRLSTIQNAITSSFLTRAWLSKEVTTKALIEEKVRIINLYWCLELE